VNWKRIEPTKIDKIGFRTIVTKNFVVPDGRTHDFQTTNQEGVCFAGCIALTKDNKVIVASQFRAGPELVMDEIPGGEAEVGEDLEMAARRELKEETGYIPGQISKLGLAYKDAYNNATWHYFLATECILDKSGQDLDNFEFIKPRLISIEELFENAQNAKMSDVAAVFLAHDYLSSIINKDRK
jgi:ADP-ribose pyrophosphatase